MADGSFSSPSSIHNALMVTDFDGRRYLMVDPWLIIGQAAHYRLRMEMFEDAGCQNLAQQEDYMLGALQTLAGVILHNDPDYFTFGDGFEEYMVNTGQE